VAEPFLDVCERRLKSAAGGGSTRKGSRLPVEQVEWTECRDWCRRNGLRPPTEAEWEYTCRAGTPMRFSSGDSESRLGEYAWHGGGRDSRTHEVATRKPNPWGLFDMHGNVYEWCEDWKGPYSEAPRDGTARMTQGIFSCRVHRGGSWANSARFCRSASRGASDPDSPDFTLGFRPAEDAP